MIDEVSETEGAPGSGGRGMSVAKSLPAESRATENQLGEDIIARIKRSSITKLNAMHRVQ